MIKDFVVVEKINQSDSNFAFAQQSLYYPAWSIILKTIKQFSCYSAAILLHILIKISLFLLNNFRLFLNVWGIS